MKAMKPSFEGVPLGQDSEQKLFGQVPHADSSVPGASTVLEEAHLSQAGDVWASNKPYGESLGREAAPVMGSRYVVQGEIAHGGMGVVFRALDREVGRQIAIKILREKHQGKPDLVRRFIEEAQVTGQLQHPGIAPVYEIGYLPGNLPYFTMKLIEGHTLDELLKRRKKDPDETTCSMGRLLKIFEQVAQTMAYAHSKGVIHRDLKPHNVMVGAFGEVQVMDWGLAKPLKTTLGVHVPTQSAELSGYFEAVKKTVQNGAGKPDESSHISAHTKIGAIVGTPAYMAPEQARGELGVVDYRSDVFGLGSILCEILIGQPPFPGATGADSCDKARRGDLEATYRKLEEAEADAGWIVLARECLSVDQDFRPPDAGNVAARVSAYLADLEARIHKAEQEQAKAQMHAQDQISLRRLWRRWTLLLVTLVSALALGGMVWVYNIDQWALQEARYQTKLAETASRMERNQGDLKQAVVVALTQLEGFRKVKRFSQAQATLEQVELLLGNRPDAALRRQLAAARRELAIVVRLDALHSSHGDGGGMDADEAYAQAFASAGLQAESDPALAAQYIARSSARNEIEAGLDEWFFMAVSPKRRQWLRQVRMGLGGGKDWRLLWDEYEANQPQKMLKTAVAAKGASGHLLLACGNYMRAQGLHEDAIAMLRLAHDRMPDDLWINDQLGVFLCDEHPADAVGFCRAAVALGPHKPLVYEHLARALSKSGREDEAKAALARASALSSENPRVRRQAGTALHGVE